MVGIICFLRSICRYGWCWFDRLFFLYAKIDWTRYKRWHGKWSNTQRPKWKGKKANHNDGKKTLDLLIIRNSSQATVLENRIRCFIYLAIFCRLMQIFWIFWWWFDGWFGYWISFFLILDFFFAVCFSILVDSEPHVAQSWMHSCSIFIPLMEIDYACSKHL